MVCETCVNCKAKTAPDNSIRFVCILNPPVPLLLPQQSQMGGMMMTLISVLPDVELNSSCSHWALKDDPQKSTS